MGRFSWFNLIKKAIRTLHIVILKIGTPQIFIHGRQVIILTFYRSLTPFYDEIFPTNVKALNFLEATFKQGGLLLDVGAGTGNMALFLAKEGFNVIATEPEEAMAQQIRE